MSLDLDTATDYKNKFCVINFLLCCCLIVCGDASISNNIKALLGLLIVTLGPLFWNSWLYKNMFETQKSRQIISYRVFSIIGLLMVLGLFSGLMAVFVECLFEFKKSLNIRWFLMVLLFLAALLFVKRKK